MRRVACAEMDALASHEGSMVNSCCRSLSRSPLAPRVQWHNTSRCSAALDRHLRGSHVCKLDFGDPGCCHVFAGCERSRLEGSLADTLTNGVVEQGGDRCYAAARRLLIPARLAKLESEGRSWRSALLGSVEQYHNQMTRAWLKFHPEYVSNLTDLHRRDFRPLPPPERPIDAFSEAHAELLGWQRFDLFLPRAEAERAPICRKPVLLGTNVSAAFSLGGYTVCALDTRPALDEDDINARTLTPEKPACVVYSIGSNNDFDFEESARRPS